MGEEVTITYETLYELYRREKDRVELQELPASFFADVAAYLAEKEAAVRPTQGSIFDNDAQKARIQVDNVKKILKTLYYRRESKILNMAMVKARTQSIINMQPLLDPEKDLYNSVVSILNMYRGGVLQSLMMGNSVRMPARSAPAPSPSLQPAPSASPAMTRPVSLVIPAQPPDVPTEHSPLKPEQVPFGPTDQASLPAQQRPASQTEPTQDTIISLPHDNLDLVPSGSRSVRFLCAVPKFVGPNLEVYGPFSENDTAMLPDSIVNVLLNKGRIVMQATGPDST